MFSPGATPLTRITAWTVATCITMSAVGGQAVAATNLTAEQIVAKHVAARGGLEAWRKIDTMIWIGHLETGNPAAPLVPFVLQMKRPNKRRFDVHLRDETSVRIFNGNDGWKLRPSHGGVPELLPYTDEEIKAAHDGPGIDGPLFDYQAKGVTVDLETIEELEGHKAYRLLVTLPSHASQHVWIDAKSFLDVQYDRESHTATGGSATVTAHLRSFKPVGGLQIPHAIVTDSGPGNSEKMIIDQVMLNPPLGDSVFARPNVPSRRSLATPGGVPPPPRGRGPQPPISAPPSPPDSPTSEPK
jgi:hypothetical protein